MSDVVDDSALRIDNKCLLREACVEPDATSHDYNQIKVKGKEVKIVVKILQWSVGTTIWVSRKIILTSRKFTMNL